MAQTEYEVPPEFRDAVAELLYHSQMIEALLRVYLTDINEAADVLLHLEGVRFKAGEKVFRRRTLGQLVKMFELHSDNAELIGRLGAFAEHRNTAAHTAYVWSFVNSGQPELVAAELAKVREHCVEGRTLVELVTVEVIKAFELKTDPRLHVVMLPKREGSKGRPGRA